MNLTVCPLDTMALRERQIMVCVLFGEVQSFDRFRRTFNRSCGILKIHNYSLISLY